jgi:hypothetical protein
MTQQEKPTTAFILSLIAGVFIILGGGMMSFLGYGFMGMMGRYGNYWGWNGMMGPGFGMMGFAFGMMGILGLVFGVIVIISALMLNSKPQEHTTWGTLILVFSVLSIFGSAMGGFGIGLILGIIGGILAITWKPVEKK